MKIMAFIRAMKWKGLIIFFVITSLLGLALTMYSCNKPERKETVIKQEKTEPQPAAVMQCTIDSCTE